MSQATSADLSALRAPAESYRWFSEARVGLFIHYGLFTILGRHEWAMCYERIPPAEYRKLIDRFEPTGLDVRQWCRLARESGQRYACLTTRHCEGFALWDSQASDFNSMRSPARRDLVREFVDACREEGIAPCLYYSVADWSDPGFVAGLHKDPESWAKYVEIAHAQLLELMSNYGKIHYLFYDGCPPAQRWDSAGINARIRQLQPDILISNRSQLDIDIPSAEQYSMADPGRIWESCITLNQSWGYNTGDRNWKTPRQLIDTLAFCVHNRGNLLVNIGPRLDGSIDDEAAALLDAMGKWLKRNGEAIYGTEPRPFDFADQTYSTARGDTAYIALRHWFGSRTTIAGIANRVQSVRLLGDDRDVAFEQDELHIRLVGLPDTSPDPIMPVVAMKLDGPPRGIPHPLLNTARYD